MVIVSSYYKAKIYIWNIRGDSNTRLPTPGVVFPIKLLTYRSHLLVSQTDKRENVGCPTYNCCIAWLWRGGSPRPHWFFKKRWCVFWWVFPSPTNNLSFFTGADLRPSSPIPGHEGLRPPSWGCVVIRRGRWWVRFKHPLCLRKTFVCNSPRFQRLG